MEIYITIHLASLERPLIEPQKLKKEGPEVAEYILKKPGHHEHLSFEALIAPHNAYWSYAVYRFYAVMVRCDWIKSKIVRMILKSGTIDPLQNHINVVTWERKVSANGLDCHLYPRSIIKPINILSQLRINPFHNHVIDILPTLNINGSFPNNPRFKVNIEVGLRALKPPESGLSENNDHLWPLRDYSLSPAMQTEGRAFTCCSFARTGYRRIIEPTFLCRNSDTIS